MSRPGRVKQAIMAKTSPGEYVRQVRQEMRKVTWPTWKETYITTIMVFIMALLMALFFLGVDFVLGNGVKWLLSLGS